MMVKIHMQIPVKINSDQINSPFICSSVTYSFHKLTWKIDSVSEYLKTIWLAVFLHSPTAIPTFKQLNTSLLENPLIVYLVPQIHNKLVRIFYKHRLNNGVHYNIVNYFSWHTLVLHRS